MLHKIKQHGRTRTRGLGVGLLALAAFVAAPTSTAAAASDPSPRFYHEAYYQFRDAAGRCLTHNPLVSTAIVTTCTGSSTQAWKAWCPLSGAGEECDYLSWVINRSTGKCLGRSSDGTGTYANVTTCNGSVSNAQVWYPSWYPAFDRYYLGNGRTTLYWLGPTTLTGTSSPLDFTGERRDGRTEWRVIAAS